MPRRQKSGEDNPKRRGAAPPFWSLGGAGGEIETPPAFSLGGSKGGGSLLKENLSLCLRISRREIKFKKHLYDFSLRDKIQY